MPDGRDISVYAIVEQITFTECGSCFDDPEVLLVAVRISGTI